MCTVYPSICGKLFSYFQEKKKTYTHSNFQYLTHLENSMFVMATVFYEFRGNEGHDGPGSVNNKRTQAHFNILSMVPNPDNTP